MAPFSHQSNKRLSFFQIQTTLNTIITSDYRVTIPSCTLLTASLKNPRKDPFCGGFSNCCGGGWTGGGTAFFGGSKTGAGGSAGLGVDGGVMNTV